MKPMAPKYIFLSRSRFTAAIFATSPGFGAESREPSSGVGSSGEIGGPYCALPKM